MKTVNLTLPGAGEFFIEEPYKILRTNIQFCGKDKKVIAITSSKENEGKTTVTLHIAKSFSELGKRVLVIDADMRKSVMAKRNSSVKDASGLSEILTGLSSISKSVCATQYKNLFILFSGKFPPNPTELLNEKHFSELIDNLKGVFDYIFIDTPPLGQVIDAAVIAPNCDGSILVIGDSKVRRKDVYSVVEQINKSGCKLIGAVRNNAKENNGKYYYKHKYQYK